MPKCIRAFYFSPTGTTKAVITYFAQSLARHLEVDFFVQSYTLSEERDADFSIDPEDVLIWGSPVYAGRIPNKTLDFVKAKIKGWGNPAIPIVVYGNRSFDNGLSELTGIMQENGCVPVAAAAIVARHTFSDVLAKGRPDQEDYEALDNLAAKAAEKIKRAENGEIFSDLVVPGDLHPGHYYVPLKTDGTPAGFLRAKPYVDAEKCSGCGRCKKVCPMNSIDMADASGKSVPQFRGICIKCQACIKSCQHKALTFKDEEFLSHKKMLEENYTQRRKESEGFW